jgi:hypothetical protein
VPIILMDLPQGTYWSRWQQFLRDDLVPRGYISENELNLVKLHTSAQAAVKEIAGFYRNYHSYRFVKRDLVICLNHPPSPALIDRLNREFADIITDGEIRLIEPCPKKRKTPRRWICTGSGCVSIARTSPGCAK